MRVWRSATKASYSPDLARYCVTPVHACVSPASLAFTPASTPAGAQKKLMTVHLIKLCVGVDTVQELKDWQAERLASLRRCGEKPELRHRTLQTPRRRVELLDGGSLYWVIKGHVLVRQRVADLVPDIKDDGTACCAIVFDPDLVATRAQPRRAFQGWRYLSAADAPPDRGPVADADDDGPAALRAKLRELRLIDG
jgi:hypothetical protein